MNEKESCPLCLSLPCDWVADPHKATDALFLAIADLRIKSGIGEKPMLSDLPQAVGDRLSDAAEIIKALKIFIGAQNGREVDGKSLGHWINRTNAWLKVTTPK